MGVPAMPPLAKRQLPRLTHWPHRSRCKARAVGGGREEVRARTDQERGAPHVWIDYLICLLYTSPSPRDRSLS
eukprot:3825775-Pyramimonas_sp.AAC.1